MVATQLLRFHGELPSLRFEGWRSRGASTTQTTTTVFPHDPTEDPTAASQHLIITRSRPLSSICPSPVYARLSRHVSGLWRWSLYRLVGPGETEEQQPQYDPHGTRTTSGLTLEAEARINELKRVLNLPEDRPPVLAAYTNHGLGLDAERESLLDRDWEHISVQDIESVLDVDLESVLELVTERYLGAPFEESRIEEVGNEVDNEVDNEPTSTQEHHTPSTREQTPKALSPQKVATTPSKHDNTSKSHTPKTPVLQRVSPRGAQASPTPEPVAALGMTPMNISKSPLKESTALRVPSPTELSPLSGARSTMSPVRAQTGAPSTPPSQLRDGLKSTPQKSGSTSTSATTTPVKSVPSTPHKSLPSPPSSPLGAINIASQEQEGTPTSPSTPNQQPQPLPMSPGRDVLSPGVPWTPSTHTGTDATPLSPRTPLSPPSAFYHQHFQRNESHSELLEHVERFKSGSIRSLEAVQAGLQSQNNEQTSEQQESELARVFKRIRGRQAVIS
ncbi:hypothetical protein CJU90_6064 [Yarrowia sp. C11]|nr:hypothetical protein CJU90_6064 [Yarrowia sp. C11]KAG5370779.1 hypothetical protein CKK34_0905 [Yarrowia sp. E02]